MASVALEIGIRKHHCIEAGTQTYHFVIKKIILTDTYPIETQMSIAQSKELIGHIAVYIQLLARIDRRRNILQLEPCNQQPSHKSWSYLPFWKNGIGKPCSHRRSSRSYVACYHSDTANL